MTGGGSMKPLNWANTTVNPSYTLTKSQLRSVEKDVKFNRK
eukprot:CAMPEP_0184657896 /NCGR_PEP_ID=MMETSP0308-20130426/22525_1 /TAXON_ID=38269 /ORGANISM="Gloeochaete witrockiana, Strain SAG 46.84" /LENGTH=40 /DNA_ID= /DNA_START= /DNA_END= /DNA_ORIENTATION=